MSNNNYCIHGNYVGNILTADFICGYCEDGVTLEEFVNMKKCFVASRVLHTMITDLAVISMSLFPASAPELAKSYSGLRKELRALEDADLLALAESLNINTEGE